MKKLFPLIIIIALVAGIFSACGKNDTNELTGSKIELSDSSITVNGAEATSNSAQAVYIANDIIYYEDNHGLTYGEGNENDAHEKSEAEAHTVVHIREAGNYIISGQLSKGQIAVDLGDGAKENPEAVVTLILNNTDITCTVAPAVIFYNVYECGTADEDTATKDVDTRKAGANVIIADGSKNNINGSYVAKIYEPDSVVLNEDKTEVEDAKKLHKYDGAFYSKMSMNINGGEKGDGKLNIKADNEGIGSELHLTINSGNINIVSGNDGINTNEDNVSVTTVNGGSLNIFVDGSTGEGDGIDSNGWLVINGGNVVAQACATSGDAGIDSDKGIHINGGTVYATGNMLDRISESEQNYAVFSFAGTCEKGTYTLKNSKNEIVAQNDVENRFTYLIVSGEKLTAGDYTLWNNDTQLAGVKAQNAMGGMGGTPPQAPADGTEFPEGMTMPEGMTRPEKPEGMTMPEGAEPPEKPEGMTMPEGAEPPEKPEGMTMPEGAEPPSKPDGMQRPNENPQEVNGEKSSVFKVENGGNYFNSVSAV